MPDNRLQDFENNLEKKNSKSSSSSFKSAMDVSISSKSFKSFMGSKEEEGKEIEDVQINHSKLTRQILKLLVDLMIDFNEAIIIQMTLDRKMCLRDMLETALKNRAKLQEGNMLIPTDNKYSSAQCLDFKENDLLIL